MVCATLSFRGEKTTGEKTKFQREKTKKKKKKTPREKTSFESFILSSFRAASLRLFALRLSFFSHGVFSPQKDEMEQTSHHILCIPHFFFVNSHTKVPFLSFHA